MTTELLWELECRFVEGENNGEIARALDISPHTVNYWRERMGYETSEVGRPKAYLTIKHARNGRIIAQGTFTECAEQMGKSVNYIKQMERKTRIGELKKYVIEHNN